MTINSWSSNWAIPSLPSPLSCLLSSARLRGFSSWSTPGCRSSKTLFSENVPWSQLSFKLSSRLCFVQDVLDRQAAVNVSVYFERRYEVWVKADRNWVNGNKKNNESLIIIGGTFNCPGSREEQSGLIVAPPGDWQCPGLAHWVWPNMRRKSSLETKQWREVWRCNVRTGTCRKY